MAYLKYVILLLAPIERKEETLLSHSRQLQNAFLLVRVSSTST